jgi:hypothetical protein
MFGGFPSVDAAANSFYATADLTENVSKSLEERQADQAKESMA